jgi:hypothetical protein
MGDAPQLAGAKRAAPDHEEAPPAKAVCVEATSADGALFTATFTIIDSRKLVPSSTRTELFHVPAGESGGLIAPPGAFSGSRSRLTSAGLRAIATMIHTNLERLLETPTITLEDLRVSATRVHRLTPEAVAEEVDQGRAARAIRADAAAASRLDACMKTARTV